MTAHNPLKILNPDKIAACAKDLKELGPDTEPEFLSIGRALNSLAGICYEITDNAVKLSSLAQFRADHNGPDGDSSVGENTKIFQDVTDHVRATLTSLGAGEDLLVELLAQMKKLRGPLKKLQSIGKTFRVLGVGIKVESSRTREGMQGFLLLAEEVAEIAKLVQENCRYCIDKADLVEKDISISRQVLNGSDHSYDASGEEAIYNILASLEDIGQRADQLAAGIQERSAAMVEGISEVVMAMQFHDITRQQLENVAAALTETIDKASNLSASNCPETSEQVVLEIYSILSMQVAHLNSIYEQVRNAGKQITAGLGNTMEQARVQAKDAGALLAMEGQNGNKSVVAGLEREIDNIVISLNISLQAVKQAAEVSREVYDNVLEIGSFVNKIEGIALDVKILAINAMVEALKTETAGNALKVLAKELSNLSQETRDGATDSIDMLQGIMAGTEKQLEFSVNLNQSSVVVDEMIAGAKECTGTILCSLQEVGMIGHKMDGASRNLTSRITKLIPDIKFPHVLGERIDRNWQIICRTLDRIEDAYPQFREGNPKIKQMLEKLANQYVMERERSIHAQVAGTTANTEDVTQGFGDASSGQEDFGDNIELF